MSDTSDQEPSQPAAQPRPPIDRSLPADPEAYDSPRAVLARQRGLSAPYIAGGRDPQPGEGAREDRYYGRILIIMVVVLILSGFVLGIIANLITGGG